MDGFDKLGVHSEGEALLELVEREQLQFRRVENEFLNLQILSFAKQRDIEQAGGEGQTNLVAIIAIHFKKKHDDHPYSSISWLT